MQRTQRALGRAEATLAQQTAQPRQRPVVIAAGDVRLAGDLTLPDDAPGVVVFAHGSGSGRFSPRNRAVAGALARAGPATLLMDLLTEQQEEVDLRTRRLRFDIGLLGRRVVATVDWLASEPSTSELPVSCFGAGTAPPRRSSRPPSGRRARAPSCRVAGARTWPARRCVASRRRPC
jgi:hypothetical protein